MSMTTVLALALVLPSAPPAPAPHTPPAAVAKGLKWLTEQQKPDGSWTGTGDGYATYMTANAGLALLMEGSTLAHGTYAPNLRRALAWMEKNAADSGLIGGTHPTELAWNVPGHGTALLFLVSVYEADGDEPRRKRMARVIDRAIVFAAGCQNDRGGWGYVSNQKDDGYCYPTLTVLQALFAARKAGFAVSKGVTHRAMQYLVSATDQNGGVGNSAAENRNVGGTDPQLSAGAASTLLMSEGPRPDALPLWVKNGRAGISLSAPNFFDGVEMFKQYFMARAAFCLGDAGHRRLDPAVSSAQLVAWSKYKRTAFKMLATAQKEDGSWPEAFLGAVHTTALALIVLQLDNEYVPALAR